MNIVVTGGNGSSGRLIVQALRDRGDQVVVVDIATMSKEPGRWQIDLTDYAAVAMALADADAVVHFGANPYPDTDPVSAADRFKNNTMGTFNVFNACVAHGIKRIVWASSETIQGYPFHDNAPPHIPLSEGDVAPQNAYAISKLLCEQLAEHLCRLHSEMTIIGLRLSNILYADALAPDPVANGNRLRDTYRRVPTYWSSTRERRFNLWGYIDSRDVVTCVLLALAKPLKGAHACLVVAADTIMNRPTRELVESEFPDTPVDPNLTEFGGAMSGAHAEALLGFRAKWSWRDVAESAQ